MTLAATMRSDMYDIILNTDEHAVACTYVPLATGTPKSIKAIIDPMEDVDRVGVMDGVEVPRQISYAIYDDSTLGIARPIAGDTITVSLSTHPLYNVTYKVNSGHPDGHGAHYGMASLHENQEKTVENYRMRRGR